MISLTTEMAMKATRGGDGVINFTLLPAGKGEFYGTMPAGLTKRGLRRRSLK